MDEEVMPVISPHNGGLVIVKLALLISKNIFPTASILMRAVLETEFGITKASVPSFAVLSDNTNGKVLPPSVLIEIFTLAQLTGERFVLFTLQVIVWVEPALHETAVLGAVTAKGPAVPFTVTTTSAKEVCPIVYPLFTELL
jgi:hypothetical protein